MSRSIRIATLLAAAALGVTLSACGTEEEAPAPTSVTATVSENLSAPVVAGPKPGSATATSSAADDTADAAAGERSCGTTAGPDGALRILVSTDDVTCEQATALATEYGPKIATGQPQTVNGWDCGPSQQSGVLASCSKGDAIISFAP